MNNKNFTLNFGLNKLFDFIVFHHRKKMYKILFRDLDSNAHYKLLDIGSTSDTGKSSNAFLHFFPNDNIVSISDQEISFETKKKFPNVDFRLGDGRALEFADAEFDLVFSNAVLEHVGANKNIEKFITEANRVSRSNVILITPNRWFPLETHTKILFIHWLPKKLFRRLLKFFGLNFFASEENLNLLTPRDVKKIMVAAGIQNYKIESLGFFGIPSNILVRINKGL